MESENGKSKTENGTWRELRTSVGDASQFPISLFQFLLSRASLEKAPENR